MTRAGVSLLSGNVSEAIRIDIHREPHPGTMNFPHQRTTDRLQDNQSNVEEWLRKQNNQLEDEQCVVPHIEPIGPII